MLKSETHGFVICHGGSDMCFVLGFGWKRPNLKQYRISALTCNLSYKHLYFLPGGNNKSPSLMFLSLKLDIEGHEPTIKYNAPSWSYNLLGESNKHNEEHERILKN